MRRFLYSFLAFLAFSSAAFADTDSKVHVLNWDVAISNSGQEIYTFTGVFYDGENPLYPLYHDIFYSYNDGESVSAWVVNPVFEQINQSDLLSSVEKEDIPDEFIFYTQNGVQMKRSVTTLFVNPFYKEFGIIYRLKSFEIETGTAALASTKPEKVFEETSVLNSGDWYPFYVSESGMYAVTGAEMAAMGIDISGINPENIAVFGNGGAMLPEENVDERPADIQQIAAQITGGEDGSFDPEDKIVFYAEGPVVWRYNDRYHRYEHFKHLYSDVAGYYLTILSEPAKRVTTVQSVSDDPTHIVNTYTRLLVHEEDDHSIIHSGKSWFGKEFTPSDTEINIDFYIPDVDTTEDIFMLTEFVSRSIEDKCYFNVSLDGTLIADIEVRAISAGDNTTFARSKSTQSIIQNHSNDNLSLAVLFEPGNSNSLGWIDYFELHAVSHLRYSGEQYPFRNLPSFGYQRVAQFNLYTGGRDDLQIWDITAFNDAAFVEYTMIDDTARFTRPSMELHEYIVFGNDDLMSPEFGDKIENQDLHAATPVDYLVITHPLFVARAERLAQIHEQHDGYSTMVVEPQKIYNEFSAGVQDITAIRDFIRSMYLKSDGEQPKYVALMGDASYDYKGRIDPDNNFVPTFQSEQSLSISSSWDTDDFFALMDDQEGDNAEGLLDIGVGRFPVSTPEQADLIIDKVEAYMTRSFDNSSAWKNKIVFIADDGDSNLHFAQAENLTVKVDTTFKYMNVEKIYYDAYQRISVSGGYRYPDAKQAVIDAVENGALIVNYTGHGGETGWGMENVLEIPDINSWTNFHNLPVFITATCEFSRYDNPEHISAGELVILNPEGGAVSMLTTSRLSFAQINFVLNQRIYDIALNKISSEKPALGDLMIHAKVPHQNSTKNFVILGDPALRLAVPEMNVLTDEITVMEQPATMSTNDTVRGLEHFSVKGRVAGMDDLTVTSFNGSVNVKLYDKPSVYSTLGQAGDSEPAEFKLLDKLLFDGYANVVDGEFEIEVLIPKDINYQYGTGKISYYAIDSLSLEDASGYYNNLVIGGYNSSALDDNAGPEIMAYMNSKRFTQGDKTNENPVFIAEITDPCGINCIGNSIGHNITAYLDDEVDQIIDLNPYYIPTPGVYNSGKVVYPFYGLSEGIHTITIKAWDLCNNSTITTVEFIVSSSIGVEISDLDVVPNPVGEYTDITFSHNMPGRNLDVRLEIYDVTGRTIRTLESSQFFESPVAGPYRWDRRDYRGRMVKSGVYPFRISVRSNSGEYTLTGGTLILK